MDKASNYFRRSTALDPKYYIAWNNLGVVLYTKGKFDEAKVLTKRLCNAPPNLHSKPPIWAPFIIISATCS